MHPGACYTVVAAGAPGVTELDLALTSSVVLPGFNPTAAKDPETGALATLGKQPNCFKWAWPLPAPVKVVMTVTGGAGLAAAQLFVK